MGHLDIIQSRLHPELTAMNDIIHDTLATDNALMNEVVTSYLKTKGKQIRPIMVMLAAKMFGEVNERVLYAAAALEMLPNPSLIHDDVVDETSLRRGEPTINSLWGNHLAVLVGDYFVSNALAAGIHTGHLSIIAALSDLGKELSLGEIDQICNVRHHDFQEESYLSMIRKKTASLFRNCVKMGAEASGICRDARDVLPDQGRHLRLLLRPQDRQADWQRPQGREGYPAVALRPAYGSGGGSRCDEKPPDASVPEQ